MPASLRAPRHLVWPLLAMVVGCGDGGGSGTAVGFDIHVPPPPQSADDVTTLGDRCPRNVPDQQLKRSDITALRVTFTDTATGSFVCDAVLSTGTSDTKRIAVPRFASSVDLLVEGFTGVGAAQTLVASGQTFDVAVGKGTVIAQPDAAVAAADAQMVDASMADAQAIDGGRDGGGGMDAGRDAAPPDIDASGPVATGLGLPHVMLTPAREFACSAEPAAVARAFHQATLLPNGQVLITGGLVADRVTTTARAFDLGSRTFLASSAVEVYDPTTGRFVMLDQNGGKARAFHQAILLDSPAAGPYKVLLVGGLGPAAGMSPETTSVVVNTQGIDRMRLVPAPGATAQAQELLEYTPARGKTPFTLTRTMVDDATLVKRMLASGSPSGAPLIVGGVTAWDQGVTPAVAAPSIEVLDHATGHLLSKSDLAIARIGASVVPLAGGRALLWGGDLQTSAGNETRDVATLLDGLPGTPTAQPLALASGASPPVPTVFGTATALGPNEALVTGGFQISAGFAIDPPISRSVQLLHVGSDLAITDITSADWKPVGYHQATRVSTGEVLLTGGSPIFMGGGRNDCPDMLDGLLCSLDRAYVATPTDPPTAVSLSMLTTPMLVSRFGHRAITLRDGSVLITGGMHYQKGMPGMAATLSAVASAELWNPYSIKGVPVSLPGGATRNPGDVARLPSGTPVRQCTTY